MGHGKNFVTKCSKDYFVNDDKKKKHASTIVSAAPTFTAGLITAVLIVQLPQKQLNMWKSSDHH